MNTIKFLKTVDLAVQPENFERAVAVWERLLGEKAIPMKPEFNPGGKSKAAHIPLPKGEYSCHSIGIFTYTDEPAPDNERLKDHLQKHGEGVLLLAFMVSDIEKAQTDARQAGFSLAFESAERYAVGVHNMVKPCKDLQDLEIQLAVHDEGGFDTWKSGT